MSVKCGALGRCSTRGRLCDLQEPHCSEHPQPGPISLSAQDSGTSSHFSFKDCPSLGGLPFLASGAVDGDGLGVSEDYSCGSMLFVPMPSAVLAQPGPASVVHAQALAPLLVCGPLGAPGFEDGCVCLFMPSPYKPYRVAGFWILS